MSRWPAKAHYAQGMANAHPQIDRIRPRRFAKKCRFAALALFISGRKP
jgi:hypothetical protein